jgi:cellulose synthase/poly-beta-1,6-N-acetylglucosamine synthase-like glycosyltransferase
MDISISILLWFIYLASLYFVVFWFLVFMDSRQKFKKEAKKIVSLKDRPFVSILIPAYNEEDSLGGSVHSVLQLDYPKDKMEVIIINDGSRDKTKEVAENIIMKNKSNRIILVNQPNQGKGAALNSGLRIAKGDYFACLDADSFVERDTLKKMLMVYQDANYKDLAIVTPAMKVKNPKNLLQKLQWLEYLLTMFVARLMSKIDCIYVAPGPFSLYRTSIIKNLGGFDNSNITEDQEIAYRAQKHHYGIKQCFDAYVYTISPSTTKSLYKQRNRWYKGSLVNIFKYRRLFWNRHYGDFGLLQMTVNSFMFIFSLAALFFAAYFTLKPLFKSIRDLYLVGFDILPYLKTLEFNINLLNIDAGKFFVLYLLVAFALLFIFISYKNANEKVKKHGILYMVPYFFVYYLVLAFIAVIATIELMLGKRQKW